MKKIILLVISLFIFVGLSYSANTSVGDDLGNHKATEDMDLQGFDINDCPTIDDIYDSSGVVVPTVFIAAYNTILKEKRLADYLCDGTDDGVEINQALDYLNGIGGGRVLLSGGTFYITESNPINVSSNTVLSGLGKYVSRLTENASGAGDLLVIKDGAVNVTLENFYCRGTDQGGNGISIGNNCSYVTIRNIYMNTDDGGLGAIGIVGLGGNHYIQILDNILYGKRMTWIISMTNGAANSHVTISNNIIHNDDTSGSGISLTNVSTGVISGNIIYCKGVPVNTSASCDFITIIGNVGRNNEIISGTNMTDVGNSWSSAKVPYSGADDDLDMGAYDVDAANFTGDGAGLTNVGLSTDTVVNIAVKATENILKGQAVYVSGASGPNEEVKLADAFSTTHEQAESIGLAASDINNGQQGLIRVLGSLENVDTSMWSASDELFLGSSGNLTNIITSTGVTQHIGHVGRSHVTQGTIIVDVYPPVTFITGRNGINAFIRPGVGAGFMFRDSFNNDIFEWWDSSGIAKVGYFIKLDSLTVRGLLKSEVIRAVEYIHSQGSMTVDTNFYVIGTSTLNGGVLLNDRAVFKDQIILSNNKTFNLVRIGGGIWPFVKINPSDNIIIGGSSVGDFFYESGEDHCFFIDTACILKLDDGDNSIYLNPDGSGVYMSTFNSTGGLQIKYVEAESFSVQNEYSIGGTDGSDGDVLTTDGLGTVTFQTPGGGNLNAEYNLGADCFSTTMDVNNASILNKQFQTIYNNTISTTAMWLIECEHNPAQGNNFAYCDPLSWSRQWDSSKDINIYIEFVSSGVSNGNVWTEIGISTAIFDGNSFEIYTATTNASDGWGDVRVATITITAGQTSVIEKGKSITVILGRNNLDTCNHNVYYKNVKFAYTKE